MLRFYTLCVAMLLGCVFGTNHAFSQATQAARGAANNLNQQVQGQQQLTTGPEDNTERVKPGLIDSDASADFKQTDSGLKYRILRAGNGEKKPTAEDTVEVHYKGWLDDMRIFDSSYRRGKTTSFPLNRVIKGWTEGIQLVRPGGMIELEIPHPLAYGARGVPQANIPPNARLHFLVELKAIK